MEKRELLSPADDTASRALIDVQTATTRVKAIISECVSKGIPDDELTKRLNEVIAFECKRIKDAPFREQFRKALITSARKWHYQLMQTYRINEHNFANAVKQQPMNVELKNLLGKTPFQKQFDFRRILDDGTNPGIPVIRDYQKGLRLAVRAISAEPPKIITPKNGKAYVMSARLRAEMAVRYSAAVDSLQRLIDDGVNWCWISSHPNCSERCKDFQGKLYSLFDKPKEIDGKTYNPSGTVDGIPYEYIGKALAGPKDDGNGCISGYNCRHRAIAYEKGSRPPADYTDAEIKKAYAIDKQQRSYENRIRHLKQEEAQLRACGMTEEAKALRKKWRVLTRDYQIYSIQNDRAYYPYRYVIDREEAEAKFELQGYLDKAKAQGHKKYEKRLTELKNSFIMEKEKQREPIDFVSAKTVQEAETYMARRVSSVSYKGTANVKSLNQVNRTYAYLSDKYGINTLERISTDISPANKRKGALAEANGKVLNISKDFANNPQNEKIVCCTAKDKWIAWVNDRIKENKEKLVRYSSDTTFVNRVKKDLQRCDEWLKYSRGNVFYEDREVESVITHEVGHIIAEQKFQQLSKEYAVGGTVEKIRNVFKKAKETGDIYKISAYANTDSKEFFAECFTIFEMGEEKLPDYIQKIMEDIFQ